MSWVRSDDNWFDRMIALGLPLEEIGYLQGLISWCSRTNTFDGRMTAFKARTIAEHPDPDAILTKLIAADRIRIEVDGSVTVLHLDEHLPSEEVRDRATVERERKRRQRAHAKDNHSLCVFPACPAAVPGTVPGTSPGQGDSEQSCPAIVPGTVGYGTGQDGPGREDLPAPQRNGTWTQDQPTPPRLGVVDLTSGEISEDRCADCGEPLGWCRCERMAAS